tara:strand:+ start:2140 stop:2430 length:291 start_codon:yes stop_codon:yes gene_type:complete
MKFELKSGRKLKLKDVSIDERDELLDTIKWETDEDGSPKQMEMMHSTMTKWIRIGLDHDTSDKFLKTLTFDERVEIFSVIQKEFMYSGEEKPSNSK